VGTPIIQIANETNISNIFTAHESGIWRVKLWVTDYEQNLPFMADADASYRAMPFQLGSVRIDFILYLQVYNYETLKTTEQTWMFDPSDASRIFIHFKNSAPPFVFINFKAGALYAFSYGAPVVIGNTKTLPLLKSIPDIEDSSDLFQYQRMAFTTGNIVIDNSSGYLDSFFELFGSDVFFNIYKSKDDVEIVKKFFVEDYEIGLDEVRLSIKDIRARLNYSAPNTVYTREAFPYIDENLENRVIQDAYGECRGVEGTCINRRKVYEWHNSDTDYKFNEYFQFKFARTITSIEEINVEMNGVWIQIYPGRGIPGNNDPNSPDRYIPIHTGETRPLIVNKAGVEVDIPLSGALPDNDGVIAIWWSQALRDNPGFLHRRNGNAHRVKMTGVFNNYHTYQDIAKDIIVYYGQMSHPASYIDLLDWEEELSIGHQMGVCLSQQRSVFEWIEEIQNGSVMGFQLVNYKSLLSARLDNPNRRETFDIHFTRILNRDQVNLSFDGGFYATHAAINYNQDYTLREFITHTDLTYRNTILDIYKYEKEYNNDTFLIQKEDAELKATWILDSFSQIRPIIRNIEIEGIPESDIKLFATGWIDFSVELPRQMKALQVYIKKRNIVGRLRVKIIKVRHDTVNNKSYIDVIQQPRSWFLPMQPILFPWEERLTVRDEFTFIQKIMLEFEDELTVIDEFIFVYNVEFEEEVKHFATRNKVFKRDGTRRRRQERIWDILTIQEEEE